MKARQILDGAFGPEDLALLGHVFDKTWQEIEDRFRDDEAARDIAREWLASIIVRLGQSHDTREFNVLHKTTMEIFDSTERSNGLARRLAP